MLWDELYYQRKYDEIHSESDNVFLFKKRATSSTLDKNDVTSQPNGFIMGTVTFSEKKKKQEIEENKDP